MHHVSAWCTSLGRFARRSTRITHPHTCNTRSTRDTHSHIKLCTYIRMGTPTWTFTTLKPVVHERAPLIRQEYAPLQSDDDVPPSLHRRTALYAFLASACALVVVAIVFVAADPLTVRTVHQRARSSVADRWNWRGVRANRTNASMSNITAQPKLVPLAFGGRTRLFNATAPRNASH